MRPIIKPVLYITALAWLFAACKKDLPVITLDTSNAKEPALSATESSLVLLEARQNNTAVIFNWTKPEFNFPASFVHTLQFAKAGTNFASPVNESIGTELKKTYTEKAFNTLMLSLGLKAGQEGDIQVRVRSVMNDSVAPLYSNSHAMSVTPYSLEQFLYVPGDHQGWSPSTATIIRSPDKNNKYEGYVYIGSGNRKFKFTDAPDWSNGIFGDANASGTSGNIVSPGNDFLVASFGYWKVNADFVGKTWTSAKTDWAITGSATPGGWPDPNNVAGTMDQDMTWDATNNVMTITLNLTAGEMKFRANDAWDINFGDDGANGSLEYGGANIAIASAGNYTITLDLKGGGGKYTYNVKKN
jgi:starch-binding outer membrane protein SusE/F